MQGYCVKCRTMREIKDARAINTSIDRYLTDTDLICEHGKNSRRIAEGMSWKKVADDYNKIYNEAVSNGG